MKTNILWVLKHLFWIKAKTRKLPYVNILAKMPAKFFKHVKCKFNTWQSTLGTYLTMQ